MAFRLWSVPGSAVCLLGCQSLNVMRSGRGGRDSEVRMLLLHQGPERDLLFRLWP